MDVGTRSQCQLDNLLVNEVRCKVRSHGEAQIQCISMSSGRLWSARNQVQLFGRHGETVVPNAIAEDCSAFIFCQRSNTFHLCTAIGGQYQRSPGLFLHFLKLSERWTSLRLSTLAGQRTRICTFKFLDFTDIPARRDQPIEGGGSVVAFDRLCIRHKESLFHVGLCIPPYSLQFHDLPCLFNFCHQMKYTNIISSFFKVSFESGLPFNLSDVIFLIILGTSKDEHQFSKIDSGH